MSLVRIAALVAVVAALAAGNAAAQSFPSKPIRIVVPYPPGGTVDALARLIGPKLADAFGQPVIVENRAGAGGNIGTEFVAKSAPDGHTLLLVPKSLAIVPALYRKLAFDVLKDLAPITEVVTTELILVAATKVPASNAREMIALAKAKPGSLNYGHTGIANPLAVTMELIKLAAGADIVAVQYKGDAPLSAALLGGEVELAMLPLAAAVQNVRAGRLKGIGVTSAKRSSALPEVPTMLESGVNMESMSWQALFASAGTPRETLRRIQAEVAKALAFADVRERLPGLGQIPVANTVEEFEARFREDVATAQRVVREARIPPLD